MHDNKELKTIVKKEESGEIFEAINSIEDGMVFKSLKSLCEYLGLKYPDKGQRRKELKNRLSNYLIITKVSGYSISVQKRDYKEISTVLIGDRRVKGNHNTFGKYID